MIDLKLNIPGRSLHILCLGAHSDDIEIGCGGALLKLQQQYPGAQLHWVVFSATGMRRHEAQQGANSFASAGSLHEPKFHEFRDGFLPYVGAEVKGIFEELKAKIQPDLIFTHYGKDAHQDHRLLSELTWNTFRNHMILEYEIPKYDGDLGKPNLFIPLSEELCQQKVALLMKAFVSQQTKHWFQPQTFLALMRLRGMECNAPGGYAEAFYCRKATL